MVAPHNSFNCVVCWLGATVVLVCLMFVAVALVALIVWVLGG